MSNPYLLDRPAVISFSGGRTSAYMLHQIIDAHGGTLPSDIKVVFANTGMEHPLTLDFVQRCAVEWNVKIDWLEFDWDSKHRYKVVSHNSAARKGEPYAAIIRHKKMLPNRVMRFCTGNLKVEPIRRHGRYFYGFKTHTVVIGIRRDEQARAIKMLENCGKRESLGEYIALPLFDAEVRELDIMEFWRRQEFDLEIPKEAGNCTLCFLKGRRKLMRLIRENPELADWWIEQEKYITDTYASQRKTDATLRFRGEPGDTYDKLKHDALAQGDFFIPVGKEKDEMEMDCLCTD